MIQKTSVVLLLTWAILFVVSFNTHAEDKRVNLSPSPSKSLIVDFTYCRSSLKQSINETILLSTIIEEEKGKSENLYNQKKICDDNFTIKENQADEWKKEYRACTKELQTCNELPWWKIDFKSMSIGALIILLLAG